MAVKKTQAEIVRDHLVAKGSITQMEASGLYCITDLAGRIRDIRDRFMDVVAGYPFDVVSESREAPNGTRYVRYWHAEKCAAPFQVMNNGNGCYLAAVA